MKDRTQAGSLQVKLIGIRDGFNEKQNAENNTEADREGQLEEGGFNPTPSPFSPPPADCKLT